VFLEREIFHTKVAEKFRTQILHSITAPAPRRPPTPPQNCAFYETMLQNIVESERPQTTIWRMRIAFWTLKTTNTHTEYLPLITFPLQQWLYVRASMLRYTYIAYIVEKYSGVSVHEYWYE
jgi:hypothetical protein